MLLFYGKYDTTYCSTTVKQKIFYIPLYPNFALIIDEPKYLQLVKAFSEHRLAVRAFLGGISITVLMLVINSSDVFKFEPLNFVLYYPHFLALWVAFVGFLFIIASFFLILLGTVTSVKNDPEPPDSSSVTLASIVTAALILAGFIGIIMFLPLLLLPFSWIGAIVLAGMEFSMLGIFFLPIWR